VRDKINWLNKIEEVEINLQNQRIVIYGENIPVGYTVLRGGENSLEGDLAKQAEKAGAKIILNSPIDIEKEKIDIIATGIGKPITVGYGRVYKGNFNPKKVKVFFSLEYTPSIGYGYFFPHTESTATVKISKQISEESINLKENLTKLKKDYLSQDIQEENFLYEFGSVRSFGIPESATKSNSLLVGEAAGFQDELFRFGMRYAVWSGYFAAKAISEGLNYDNLWKNKFLKEFKRTALTRRVFEDFKKRGFNTIGDGSDLYIDIEKFRKLWLSGIVYLLLKAYPLYKSFVFRPFFIKNGVRLLKKAKTIND
jgi:flavin-dependent dehydrogenase